METPMTTDRPHLSGPSLRRWLWGLGSVSLLRAQDPGPPGGEVRKKIAFLGTEVRTHSHAQHFLDRLAMGYGWGGHWEGPRLEIASVYIDQFPEGDLGRQRVEKYGLRLYPGIEEASPSPSVPASSPSTGW